MTTTELATAIFNRLKKFRFVIIVVAILFGLLLAMYAKNTPVTFTSKSSIFSLSSGNDYPAASSALSLILGTESTKSFSDETSINIIELAQSRSTREAVASTPVPSMGNKIIAALLADDINNHLGWIESKVVPPKNPDKLIIWGGSVLKNGITANINKNSMLVLTYTGRSEALVKEISNAFIDKISKFYIDLKKEKAQRDFEFATGKVDSLRRVMSGKDYMLIAIDKKTLFTNTDKLEFRVPHDNLLADKQMIRTQYAQAVSNQQSAAYKLQKATPLIKVLDKPEPPYEKHSRSATTYATIGFFMGAILMSALAISGLVLRFMKQEASLAIFGSSSSKITTTAGLRV